MSNLALLKRKKKNHSSRALREAPASRSRSEEVAMHLGIATILVSIRSSSLLVETGQRVPSELLPAERKLLLLRAAIKMIHDS